MRALALVLPVLLGLAACDPYVEGNGVYYEEDRSAGLAPFVGIDVRNGVSATVTSHAPSQTVLVSGDANVVQRIQTAVQTDGAGPVLHVWMDPPDYTSTNPPTVTVTVADLIYASARDRSLVDVAGAATSVFTARAESGAIVSIVGPNANDPAGDSIDVTAAGATVDAHLYVTTGATHAASVDLTEAAHCQLHADGPVSGTISDPGTWLDNTAGSAGTCAGVTASGGAQLRCN